MYRSEIGKVVAMSVVSPNATVGLTSFPYVLTVDGALPTLPVPVTFSEIGQGVYKVSFVPGSTGVYQFFSGGVENFHIEVVTSSEHSTLSTILSYIVGSWKWDKITGRLEYFDIDGNFLNSYEMKDSAQESSRELN